MPRLPILLLPLLFAASTLSTPATAQLQSREPTPPDSGLTFKTTSNLVVVDVVVTDKNGQPVHNLQASDFLLAENGATQNIHNFEEHVANPKLDALFLPNLPANVFTNFTPVPSNGPVNILLIDTLNTPMQDQPYLRTQVLKYLQAAHPGTRTAIFALNHTRLYMLQSFTSDPDLIRHAVTKQKTTPSPLSGDLLKVGNYNNLADMLQQTRRDIDMSAPPFVRQNIAEEQSLQEDLRAKYTLSAMNQLARYLSILPGRKNLVWFSGSFPVSLLPARTNQPGDLSPQLAPLNPFAVIATSEIQLRETTNLLSRCQIAVYPIDARGLINTYTADLSEAPRAESSTGPRFISGQQQDAFSKLAAEQSTMIDMAHQTGGKAFVNTNDLSGSLDEAIRSGANYYSLAYSPSDKNYNGKFRNIQIKMQQKGLNIAYRRGYYGDDPAHTDRDTNKALPTPTDALHLAMMWGTPEPTEVVFKARVLPLAPASAAPEPTLIEGTYAGPYANRSSGPYRNYSIDIGILSRTVEFTVTPDGHRHANLQALAIAFDKDGAIITTTANNLVLDVTAEEYAEHFRGGIQARQEISVPAKGNYSLRIGIHDVNADRVGAIEVPLAFIKNPLPDIKTISVPSTPQPETTPAKQQP